jgi:HPt (histidine-containing phosphotransfer) domain-containing protein
VPFAATHGWLILQQRSRPKQHQNKHDVSPFDSEFLHRKTPVLRQTARAGVKAAPVQPAAVVVLDAAALAALRELDPDGKLGIVKRVLTAFEKSLVRLMGQLQLHADAPPGLAAAEAVFGIAHQLKAPAASCGALALSQVCREVEQKYRPSPTRQPDVELDLRADVTRLLAFVQAALVAVRAML